MTQVQEDATHTLTIANTTGVSTLGLTVYVYLMVGDTTPVAVGNAAGAAAATDISIACDFGLVTPGVYEMEVVANPTAANPVVLIPSSATEDPVYIQVMPRRSYS